MRKLVIFLAVIAAAMMTQAATLQWRATELHDNSGAHNDGDGWATAGVNLYLVYNGVGGSFNPANWYYNAISDSLSYSAGAAPGTIVANYTTIGSDYDLGAFNQSMTGASLTWLGETVATWEAMNNRSFTIVAISDADNNFDSGATWNYYTANAIGFSTASGSSGTGGINALSFDVSGAGALNVVPEPATFFLMALGGFGTWLLRRNKLTSKEEAEG